MKHPIQNFVLTDDFGSSKEIKISQDVLDEIISLFKKLNLENNAGKLSLFTYGQLKDLYLEAGGVVGLDSVDTERYDSDCCRYIEEGKVFEVAIRAIDSNEEPFFWVRFHFITLTNCVRQVEVDWAAQGVSPERYMIEFTGHKTPYTMSTWKEGWKEMQRVFSGIFPGISNW